MTALLNPRFEDAGQLPGEAAHWTLLSRTSLEAIAGFGSAPEEAWESFERWHVLRERLDELSAVLAFFGARREGWEDFASGWGNTLYFYALDPAQAVVCLFGTATTEDYESGWQNATYAWSWSEIAAARASFDGAAEEAFEAHWRSNELYATSWAQTASAGALFGTNQPAETFDAWPRATTL